jgi:hypothetical protein
MVLPLWEMVFLALADFIVLVIFAAIGQQTHATAPQQGQALSAANIAVPFILPWLIVGGLTGTFSGRGLYPIRRVITRTLLTSLIAIPIGVVLRETARTLPYFIGFQISWMFMGVATATCALMLLVWRLIWSRVRRLWWPEVP